MEEKGRDKDIDEEPICRKNNNSMQVEFDKSERVGGKKALALA